VEQPRDKRSLRSIWADRKFLPLRIRISISIGLIFSVGAVLFALGSGVYSLFWFTHREQATCSVTTVTGPLTANSRNPYWDVGTSCGAYSINPGGGAISEADASTLAAEFQLNHPYILTFQGWGSQRSIIAAREADR
jgi:hypothetical protein